MRVTVTRISAGRRVRTTASLVTCYHLTKHRAGEVEHALLGLSLSAEGCGELRIVLASLAKTSLGAPKSCGNLRWVKGGILGKSTVRAALRC